MKVNLSVKTYQSKEGNAMKVSVMITTYNLEKYVKNVLKVI